jgi:hypothetical protein
MSCPKTPTSTSWITTFESIVRVVEGGDVASLENMPDASSNYLVGVTTKAEASGLAQEFASLLA